MAPKKTDFDLTDRGWVDLYVKKCENIMKEFTDYVYALQNHCLKERGKIEELDKNCKKLQKKLVDEKQMQQAKYEKRPTLYTPLDRSPINTDILGITTMTTPTKGEADRTTISDGSPAFLNMAMDSEQLNMESCVLSPAQHLQEILPASEQLGSPNRFSIGIDSVLQHNTSPTCKPRNNNENQSALGFLKARGRVGKTLYNEPYEHKLREQNPAANGNDNKLLKSEANLHSKQSDWFEKEKKSEERKAGLKRSASNMEEVLRKRSLMSLNKSGERKLKQSRLTQMVSMKTNKVQNAISPEDVGDAQKFAFSPTSSLASTNTTQKKLAFQTFSNDTDDIFQFSSEDDDEQHVKKSNDNSVIKQNVKKSNDTTVFQPLPKETDKSDSILAITPTAPPLICLDDSDDNEDGTETRSNFGKKMKTQQAGESHLKKSIAIVKKERTGSENLATELAAAMLAEWEEEPEHHTVKSETKPKAKAVDMKPRLSQLPEANFSIKERFNVDCDECQKYIDFMGSNMSLSEIETHLRRCTRHRTAKDDIPTTPPNYWNPLMPSFSENDPRNKTLLEDPFIQRKRGSNKS
ncbi:PREDICTED: uncharacterized protein LOC108976410 [Bactrocera latifrons]|uniref:uncharacterized protein LOC108976410 n=1 Tax=Bactrocera latifrons TaxID=174628 RepID=UPI0008DCC490|nr:PREDICTED: uncharacterized protein LOC108976410 [Bactrocera latifrons]XP_018801027.1 PREDICTED: uncharacterized protein LOC108976410 [Bactrocera latifrons]